MGGVHGVYEENDDDEMEGTIHCMLTEVALDEQNKENKKIENRSRAWSMLSVKHHPRVLKSHF